jgi:hypothetical protein
MRYAGSQHCANDCDVVPSQKRTTKHNPTRIRLDMTRSTLIRRENRFGLPASEPQDHPVAQHPSYQLWRTIGCLANDSNASLRRYQKMKYAADNALGILKNSACYVIVWRHGALKQRMIGTKLRFRTPGLRHSRYNRYKLTARAARREPLHVRGGDESRTATPFARRSGRATPNLDYFWAFIRSSATLASETTRGATYAF